MIERMRVSTGESGRVVARLTRTMLLLWLMVSAVFVWRLEWGGLGVLTLAVAAAIVQLRWLASQVAALVSLTLRPTDLPPVDRPAEPPAVVPDFAREPAVEADPLGQISPDGRGRASGEQRGVNVSLAEDAPGQIDETGAIESADRHQLSVPKTSAIVILRPVFLLGGLLVIFAVGSSEPMALAAGVLTLPAALIIEALQTAIKSDR